MYHEFVSVDVAVTLLILVLFFVALFFAMKVFTKLRCRRKRRAIEHGVNDFLQQVRGKHASNF
jgi:hypothetical protein